MSGLFFMEWIQLPKKFPKPSSNDRFTVYLIIWPFSLRLFFSYFRRFF